MLLLEVSLADMLLLEESLADMLLLEQSLADMWRGDWHMHLHTDLWLLMPLQLVQSQAVELSHVLLLCGKSDVIKVLKCH
jgi:hypothetical protein